MDIAEVLIAVRHAFIFVYVLHMRDTIFRPVAVLNETARMLLMSKIADGRYAHCDVEGGDRPLVGETTGTEVIGMWDREERKRPERVCACWKGRGGEPVWNTEEVHGDKARVS